MDPQEELFAFLQDNAEYYDLMKANFKVKILEALSSGVKDFDDLLIEFGIKEKSQLSKAVPELASKKIISSTQVGHKQMYFLSEKAKSFLEKYRSAKQSFQSGEE